MNKLLVLGFLGWLGGAAGCGSCLDDKDNPPPPPVSHAPAPTEMSSIGKRIVPILHLPQLKTAQIADDAGDEAGGDQPGAE